MSGQGASRALLSRARGAQRFLHSRPVRPSGSRKQEHGFFGLGPQCSIRTLHAETYGEEPAPFRKRLKDEAKRRKASKDDAARRNKTGSDDDRLADWELTVGIEIHAELNTAKKLFSAAATSVGDEPNSHVALFDAAFPGSQPNFQKEALLPALRAAIALGCDIQRRSSFDRKHYFYQDQPAGYQITQYYEPFAKGGSVTLYTHDGIAAEDGPSVSIPIKQIQMEQDTAKTLQQPPTTYLLDFNRVSHPLIEVISMPAIHHPATAAAYVRKVQSILKSVNACTAGMDVGGLRADVNVSIRRRNQPDDSLPGHAYAGFTGLGQRTEIKNLSSTKAVEDAIVAERDRQIAVLESGGAVEGETRGFTLGSVGTRKLRGKEGEVDYRYMPDPDVAPVIVGSDLVEHLRATLPLLPDAAAAELVEQGVSLKDAKTLVGLEDGERLEYYHEVLALLHEKQDSEAPQQNRTTALGKTVANWTVHELGALLTASGREDFAPDLVPAQQLASVLHLLLRKEITIDTARSLVSRVFRGDIALPVADVVEREGLRLQPLDDEVYERLARQVVEANSQVAAAAREKGQQGKVMWFVGQVMRGTLEGREGRLEAKRAEGAVRTVLGI